MSDRTGHADAANDRGSSPCAGISPIAESEARHAPLQTTPRAYVRHSLEGGRIRAVRFPIAVATGPRIGVRIAHLCARRMRTRLPANENRTTRSALGVVQVGPSTAARGGGSPSGRTLGSSINPTVLVRSSRRTLGTTLFRIALEAFTNAAGHASGSAVQVGLLGAPDRAELIVDSAGPARSA